MLNRLWLTVLLGAVLPLAAQGVDDTPIRVRVTLARELFMPAPVERGAVTAPVEGGDGTVDARVGDELPAMPLPERQLKGSLLAQDDETVTIWIDGVASRCAFPVMLSPGWCPPENVGSACPANARVKPGRACRRSAEVLACPCRSASSRLQRR